jgi:hypothetical protein
MKTELEIARECKLERIEKIAEKIGLPSEDLENYGKYIAKVPLKLIDADKVAKSNLILVTATYPFLGYSISIIFPWPSSKSFEILNSVSAGIILFVNVYGEV